MNWEALKRKRKLLQGRASAFVFRCFSASSLMTEEPLALHLLLPLFQACHSVKLTLSILSVNERKLWSLQVLFGEDILERIRGHLALWAKKILRKKTTLRSEKYAWGCGGKCYIYNGKVGNDCS